MKNVFFEQVFSPAILPFSPLFWSSELDPGASPRLWNTPSGVLCCIGHDNKIILIKVYLVSACTANVVLKGEDHSIKSSVCSISSKVDLGSLKNMKKVNKKYVNDYCILLQKFPRWTVYSDTQFKKNSL